LAFLALAWSFSHFFSASRVLQVYAVVAVALSCSLTVVLSSWP
jgi:hypothetical protein